MQQPVLRSVLAATDLGPSGADVLRAAAALASAAGAGLHVIHAFDLDLAAYPEAGAARHTFQGRIAAAEEMLAAQVREALPGGADAASRLVVIFVAHRAILERAREVRADVVVLGPHRGSSVEDRVLGTTADRVIRSARCPCLVVRAPLHLPLRRVVVPLDLSDPARGALETALAWTDAVGARDPGGAPGTEVDVVHVVPRLFESEGLPVNHASIGPRLHADVERALAAQQLPTPVREELVWGDDAAEEIVRYAGERRADLLVLATHGHGAVKRALIGSTASAVAQRAGCPVLLVPPSWWSGWESAPAGA